MLPRRPRRPLHRNKPEDSRAGEGRLASTRDGHEPRKVKRSIEQAPVLFIVIGPPGASQRLRAWRDRGTCLERRKQADNHCQILSIESRIATCSSVSCESGTCMNPQQLPMRHEINYRNPPVLTLRVSDSPSRPPCLALPCLAAPKHSRTVASAQSGSVQLRGTVFTSRTLNTSNVTSWAGTFCFNHERPQGLKMGVSCSALGNIGSVTHTCTVYRHNPSRQTQIYARGAQLDAGRCVCARAVCVCARGV